VGAGETGLIEAARRPAEWVIGRSPAQPGSGPTLAAAEPCAIVALATKRRWSAPAACSCARGCRGATVLFLPVDSEHNALFQAMSGSRRQACGASS